MWTASQPIVRWLVVICLDSFALLSGATRHSQSLKSYRWQRMPLGTIRPKGWLHQQASLQAYGFQAAYACSTLHTMVLMGTMKTQQPDSVLIFVDVDGVLNVGLHDPGHSPVSFTEANISQARRMYDNQGKCLHPNAEKLLSIYEYQIGDGDTSRFADLVSSSATGLSSVLVARLAEIIRAAGDQATVVLSSKWRLPKYHKRVEVLEAAISTQLLSPFKFHDKTPLCSEHTAGQRLASIKDYISDFCENHIPRPKFLKVLVLDDFNITALGDWSCGGVLMSSHAIIEGHLLSGIPKYTTATSKLIHPYKQWETASGFTVQIGAGINRNQVDEALSFLCSDQSSCISEIRTSNPLAWSGWNWLIAGPCSTA